MEDFINSEKFYQMAKEYNQKYGTISMLSTFDFDKTLFIKILENITCSTDFEEVLKDEYVYKNGKLFKALKNTVSKTENLNDRNIFIEISAYSDETPETLKEKKDNEITENVQKSKTTEIKKTEDVKVEKVEEVATELAESTEQNEVNVNQLKSKKKH